MRFLDNMAVRREAKRLQPFMRRDERFLETDVCELVTIVWREDGRRQPGGTVVMSFTNRAIYLRPTKGGDGSVLRIPYERCVDLMAGQGMVEIVTMLANYLVRDIGRPMGSDKYEVIRRHMKQLELHSELVEVPGGRVYAVCRPLDENQPGKWLLRYSEGVDAEAPEVQATLERALAAAIARYGPLSG